VLKTVPSNPSAIAESAVLQLGEIAGPTTQTVSRDRPAESSADSLFEHFAWLYIFCREKLFRDDTLRMIRELWPDGMPKAGEKLIEFGCGPGFYSCRLAELFPELGVLGVDRSPSQLKWAREKAARLGLDNCRFLRDNVLDLSHADDSFDVLVASRIFTVLPNRDRAVAEMFRVLRPGGRCFVAEPRYALRASIPLYTMWLLASITRVKNGYREPSKAKVLSARELDRLFASQPWREMKTWQDGRYQYALCEKG
jgi:ubiquinone/menaquinone biosynthesis C-methylase UbiE